MWVEICKQKFARLSNRNPQNWIKKNIQLVPWSGTATSRLPCRRYQSMAIQVERFGGSAADEEQRSTWPGYSICNSFVLPCIQSEQKSDQESSTRLLFSAPKYLLDVPQRWVKFVFPPIFPAYWLHHVGERQTRVSCEQTWWKCLRELITNVNKSTPFRTKGRYTTNRDLCQVVASQALHACIEPCKLSANATPKCGCPWGKANQRKVAGIWRMQICLKRFCFSWNLFWRIHGKRPAIPFVSLIKGKIGKYPTKKGNHWKHGGPTHLSAVGTAIVTKYIIYCDIGAELAVDLQKYALCWNMRSTCNIRTAHHARNVCIGQLQDYFAKKHQLNGCFVLFSGERLRLITCRTDTWRNGTLGFTLSYICRCHSWRACFSPKNVHDTAIRRKEILEKSLSQQLLFLRYEAKREHLHSQMPARMFVFESWEQKEPDWDWSLGDGNSQTSLQVVVKYDAKTSAWGTQRRQDREPKHVSWAYGLSWRLSSENREPKMNPLRKHLCTKAAWPQNWEFMFSVVNKALCDNRFEKVSRGLDLFWEILVESAKLWPGARIQPVESMVYCLWV